MSVKHPVTARLGSAPEDYQRLGISRDGIAPGEDGMRTDAARARLSGGTSTLICPTAHHWW